MTGTARCDVKEAERPLPLSSVSCLTSPPGILGLSVADLTEAQRRELKVKGGVRVESVDGAAAKAGVREGDVLLSIDNTEVASVKQFDAALAKLDKSKTITLLVRRGDTVNFLIVRPVR